MKSSPVFAGARKLINEVLRSHPAQQRFVRISLVHKFGVTDRKNLCALGWCSNLSCAELAICCQICWTDPSEVLAWPGLGTAACESAPGNSPACALLGSFLCLRVKTSSDRFKISTIPHLQRMLNKQKQVQMQNVDFQRLKIVNCHQLPFLHWLRINH